MSDSFPVSPSSASSGGAVELSWHVTYSNYDLGNRKRLVKLLDDIRGVVPAGSCMAIMGPSGAGKTSLMNLLAGKIDKFDGKIKLGNRGTTKNERLQRIRFVEQADMFLDQLTVGEHMQFQASLRLFARAGVEQAACIREVLQTLGLYHLYDRRIQVISGGEKKRLSIAEELLNDPPVLILDEPTSQLDSHMASTVVSTLQTLAREKQKTLLFSIHQPSSAIFQSFDLTLFLAKGRTAYYGSAEGLASFLHAIDLPCPDGFNVAEWMMDQISSTREGAVTMICDAAVSARAVEVAQRRRSSMGSLATVEEEMWTQCFAPRWVEYCAIVRRTFLQRKRQRLETTLNYISTVIISVGAGMVFFGLGDNQASVRNRTGAVFFLFVHPVFSSIFETSMPLVLDSGTLLREYKNKRLYRVSSYYIARTTGELPVQMSFPLIYGVIIYWMVGFGNEIDRFLYIILTTQLACLTGTSVGYMLSTFSTHFDVCLTITVIFLVLNFMFSGMMVDAGSLASPFKEIGYLSLFKHAFDAGIITVWRGITLTCDTGEKCLFKDGDAVLRSYSIDPARKDHQLRFSFISLAVIFIVARLIGFCRLYFRYVFDDDLRNLLKAGEEEEEEDVEWDDEVEIDEDADEEAAEKESAASVGKEIEDAEDVEVARV